MVGWEEPAVGGFGDPDDAGRLIVRVVSARGLRPAGWMDQPLRAYIVFQLGQQRYQTEASPLGSPANLSFNTQAHFHPRPPAELGQVPAFDVRLHDTEISLLLFRCGDAHEAGRLVGRGSCAMSGLRSCLTEQPVAVQLHTADSGQHAGTVTLTAIFRPSGANLLPGAAQTIELKIRTASGRVLSRAFRRGETVRHVQEVLAQVSWAGSEALTARQVLGLPVTDQLLKLGNTTLDGTCTLADYGIRSGEQIRLVSLKNEALQPRVPADASLDQPAVRGRLVVHVLDGHSIKAGGLTSAVVELSCGTQQAVTQPSASCSWDQQLSFTVSGEQHTTVAFRLRDSGLLGGPYAASGSLAVSRSLLHQAQHAQAGLEKWVTLEPASGRPSATQIAGHLRIRVQFVPEPMARFDSHQRTAAGVPIRLTVLLPAAQPGPTGLAEAAPQEIGVEAFGRDNVGELMHQLQIRTGIAVAQQRLKFGGQLMDPSRALSHYELQHEDQLRLEQHSQVLNDQPGAGEPARLATVACRVVEAIELPSDLVEGGARLCVSVSIGKERQTTDMSRAAPEYDRAGHPTGWHAVWDSEQFSYRQVDCSEQAGQIVAVQLSKLADGVELPPLDQPVRSGGDARWDAFELAAGSAQLSSLARHSTLVTSTVRLMDSQARPAGLVRLAAAVQPEEGTLSRHGAATVRSSLTVRLADGSTIPIAADLGDPADAVAGAVERAAGIPAADQLLMFGSATLDPRSSLSSAGVHNGAQLKCILRESGPIASYTVRRPELAHAGPELELSGYTGLHSELAATAPSPVDSPVGSAGGTVWGTMPGSGLVTGLPDEIGLNPNQPPEVQLEVLLRETLRLRQEYEGSVRRALQRHEDATAEMRASYAKEVDSLELELQRQQTQMQRLEDVLAHVAPPQVMSRLWARQELPSAALYAIGGVGLSSVERWAVRIASLSGGAGTTL